jgi:hypothetical protein
MEVKKKMQEHTVISPYETFSTAHTHACHAQENSVSCGAKR